MYSKTIIIGHVGGDAEMRYTPSGSAVSNFNVAVKSGYGENETTNWYRVAVWNRQAETAANYVKKGMLIYLEGEVSVNSYARRDGSPGASLEMTAFQMKFLSSRNDMEGASESTDGGYGADGEYEAPADSSDSGDDDIPW